MTNYHTPMIKYQSKNWHLFIAIITALGLLISSISLLQAIKQKDNFDLFKSIVHIILFTFWLVDSLRSYRKKALEKAR